MKAIIFKMAALLLCAGTTNVFGQSKIQKEKDEREKVSFAKIAKDTILPLKDAPKLLKELQSDMTVTDKWESSSKRQEITESNGYKHQFYNQYHKGVRVEGGEFGVHAKNDSAVGAKSYIIF